MATHSSVLAWRIPGTEKPGGLPSMGSHRVRHDWSDLAAAAAAWLRSQKEKWNGSGNICGVASSNGVNLSPTMFMRLLCQQKHSHVGWKGTEDKTAKAVRFPKFYRQKTGCEQQSCITLDKKRWFQGWRALKSGMSPGVRGMSHRTYFYALKLNGVCLGGQVINWLFSFILSLTEWGRTCYPMPVPPLLFLEHRLTF